MSDSSDNPIEFILIFIFLCILIGCLCSCRRRCCVRHRPGVILTTGPQRSAAPTTVNINISRAHRANPASGSSVTVVNPMPTAYQPAAPLGYGATTYYPVPGHGQPMAPVPPGYAMPPPPPYEDQQLQKQPSYNPAFVPQQPSQSQSGYASAPPGYVEKS